MTNPNNAIGTNGAFGGRTSVNAFNDGLSAWTRGVLSGWACEPDGGMTVALGGDPEVRDVAVAEDDAGNKTTINNISLAPVRVNIPGAPASNTRIDSIVAYVDNPPHGRADITDNYESCGLIVVSGAASASPTTPNESTIRSAITSDGATGATAYYVVLANIRVATGTTDITAGEIEAGDVAGLSGEMVNTGNITDGAITSAKMADSAVTSNKIDYSSLGIGIVEIEQKQFNLQSWVQYNVHSNLTVELQPNSTYLVIAGIGLLYNTNSLSGDIILNMVNNTPDATLRVANAYSMGVIGASRPMMGTLITGATTTYKFNLTANAASAGLYQLGSGTIVFVKIG